MRGSGDGNEGIFVVLEGIDGAGTTTQAERYAAHLRAQRRLVHVTHEPSTGPVGTMIRLVLRQRLNMPGENQAEAMALLFAADRLDHVAAEIDPLLRDGYVVISDRYDLSSLAYQSITAAQAHASADSPASQRVTAASVEWIRELNRFARRPHVTVVLDVSPDVASSRRRSRGGAVEIYEDEALQARLAAAYRRAEELVPGDRIVHLDGDRSPDEVSAALIAALDAIVSPPPAPDQV